MASVDIQLDTVGDSDFSGSLSGGHLYLDLGLSGDSDISMPLDASVPMGMTLSGDSGFSGFLLGSETLLLGLVGDSAFTATPTLDGHFTLNLVGDSNITAVLLQRKPFVPPPTQSKFTAAPNLFPGLQVGRQPAAKTSSPVIDPNPPRRRQ
jgi:hypothetical protein